MVRIRYWVGVPVVLALGAVGIFYQTSKQTDRPSRRTTGNPVTTTDVRRQDVAVYLTGLGTVTAFNRVTVHVRVDGELQAVNFTEGQDVKRRRSIAQIDPRPFQAQLDQAEATKAHDEAQLAIAKLGSRTLHVIGRQGLRHPAKRRYAARLDRAI